MEDQINSFVAAQREMAAQMLSQYNSGNSPSPSPPSQSQRDRDRERRRDRDRDRDRDRERWRDEERDHGDIDERVRSRERHDRDRSSERSSRRSYGDDRGYGSRFDNGSSSVATIDYNHGRGSSKESSDERGSRGERDDRASDKWMTDTPTNTILLRGLPTTIDEQDIKAELMMFGAPIKDVRLMKRKDTGASRGFAFVEFQNVTDSQRWMEQNQGQVTILNQYTISMFYSTPKTGGQDVRPPGDWTCSKCGVHNFKRRDHCFKCSISKDESDRSKEGDGYDQVGHNLCNTVILRGLDALTTEENIVTAVHKIAAVTMKNIRIMRDPLTQVSKGHAFIEMGSIGDSCKLIDAITKLHGPFEVDGKAIIVNYAKNTFSTVMATLNQQWTAQQFAAAQSGNQTAADAAAAAAAAAAASSQYAQGYYDTAGQFHYYDYSQYYAGQTAVTSSAGAYTTDADGTQSDTTNAAAAVAQAAIQQAQAAKAVQKKAVAATLKATDTTFSADFQYPVPDVSTYQYDETSGYYYDPTTGLYYDANSQYYYNAQTQQFLYWDGEKRTYLPSPGDNPPQGDQQQGQGQNTESGGPGDKVEKKDKDKKEKVKVAKKIAKDMEKWAKSMNAAKESQKEGMFGRAPTSAEMQQRKETAAADAGFAILEKVNKDPAWKTAEQRLMPPPPALPGTSARKQSPSAGLVPDYEDGEDSENEDTGDGDDEEKFSDWSKMACLLCKRQFPNRDGLTRHNQLSDLHKSNLEEHRKKKAASQGSLTALGKQLQYRDRAKERRLKYGQPTPPEPRNKAPAKAPVPYEQPTQQGIGEDNIGNKLMKKMGWSSGEGLGRGKTGIKDPIKATRRTMGVGLGAGGSNAVQLEPGDTYKDCVKKTMMARFAEMNS